MKNPKHKLRLEFWFCDLDVLGLWPGLSCPPPILRFPNCEIVNRVLLLQRVVFGLDEINPVKTPS